ncbi:hypothetical protein [Chitinophaga filiformis]|nr:hypothetical protein [Chitinophaga filiformis]
MKKILTLLFLSVTTLSYAQQLKLGNNPSVIKKSALLELESGSQGLLLPRISDTTSTTIKSSPDGMLIYLTLNNSLTVRSLGAWQSLGSPTFTLTGDVTGTGTGTVASTISNQAVTFAKMQNINTQKLLGRYTAGLGSTQEVSLDNSLKFNAGGTLYADSSLAIWNASKLVGLRVSSKAPANGEVLKWNGTAWESNTDNGGSSSLTLTGDVTGTGTGTVASTISNQAVTFAKMQNINTQKLLGRYTAGAGSPQEVALDNSLKLNTGGTLYADSSLAIWNASKLVGLRVSSKTPTSGEVLKWNGTAWETNTDNDGGATYGTLADNDIGNADVAGSTTRMKIWASPVTGVVTNGPAGTTAYAWSTMAFKGNNGGFTTQLYFDKNTLALKEWTGITAPLGTTAINGWYKAIMTNGNNTITNGSIIFGSVTSDASSEVGQDNANFFWDDTNNRLGVKTNAPTSTAMVNGSFSLPIRGVTSSTTLTESDYTVVKTSGANITITLPAANTCKGRIYVFKKPNNGTVTIDTNGGQIDAAASVSLTSSSRISYTIQSDGSNWWIIAGI